MENTLGALLLGYGLGLMQFAEGKSQLLFIVPMLIGLALISLDVIFLRKNK